MRLSGKRWAGKAKGSMSPLRGGSKRGMAERWEGSLAARGLGGHGGRVKQGVKLPVVLQGWRDAAVPLSKPLQLHGTQSRPQCAQI